MNSLSRPCCNITPCRKTIITWNKIWNTSKRNKNTRNNSRFLLNNAYSQYEKERQNSLQGCKLTHEYLLKKTEPPMCNQCNRILSTNHLLFECNKYYCQRQKYKITSPAALTSQKHIENVLNYLKEINIYHKIKSS